MASSFEMFSGDSKTLSVAITDTDGQSVTLTGATCAYTIREAITSTTSLVTKATGGNGITVSGSTVTITLSPSDTASLDGTYYHELQITDSSGHVSTAFQDVVSIKRDIIT
jgi:hypothetical protein